MELSTWDELQVEAISPAPEEARLLDAVEVKLQRDREDLQRRLHEIDSRLSKEETQLRFLLDRESSLAADLQKNETSASAVVASLPPQQRNRLLSELDDEKPYVNPIQVNQIDLSLVFFTKKCHLS